MLSKIELCGTSQYPLSGIRATVALLDAETKQLNGTQTLSSIGSTSVCTTFLFDYTTNEFITNMTLTYTTSKLTQIYITTNKERSIFKGGVPSTSTQETLLFTEDQPIGFWGTRSPNTIYSLAPITVQNDCWPSGVPREDPLDDQESSEGIGGGWIAAIIIAVFSVLAVPVAYFLYKAYKGKSGSSVVPSTVREGEMELGAEIQIKPSDSGNKVKPFDLLPNTENEYTSPANEKDEVIDNPTDVEI